VLARYQRDYARAVLVGTAADVRNAETRRDDVTRRERQAGEELAGAQARADELSEDRRRLQERQDATQVEVAALKESAAYREGAALSELSIRAGQLRENAGRAAAHAQERAGEHVVAVDELRAAEERRQTAEANGEQAARDLGDAAEAAGARAVVGEAESVVDPEEGERLLHAWVRAQRDRVAEVGQALDAHDRAVTRRQYRTISSPRTKPWSRPERVGTTTPSGNSPKPDRSTPGRCTPGLRPASSSEPTGWRPPCPPPEDPPAVAAAVAEVVALARSDELGRSGGPREAGRRTAGG
jgi:hypothetical protein